MSARPDRGFVGLAALAVGAGFTLAATTPAAIEMTPLVFDGVTIVDVEHGTLLPDRRVVIDGNRIKAVGQTNATPVPKSARVVDAHGRFLIPGLWDMHVHPRDAALRVYYPLFIVNGVTGIRDAWSDVPLETRLQWRRDILAGTRVGPPRQIFSTPAIDESSPCHRGLVDKHTCVEADPADGRRLVDSLKAAGYDMLKMYALSPAMYFAIADEARRVGIPFGGHADGIAAVTVADSGTRIVDHMQNLTGEGGIFTLCVNRSSASLDGCRAVAERFRQHGTWWVPTMVIYESITGMFVKTKGHAIARALEEQSSKFWWADTAFAGNWLREDVARAANPASDPDSVLAIARQAGMPIMAGTDIGIVQRGTVLPGFSLHAELAVYVAEGLTPLEALQAATLNPARMWHATDSLGTVAPGKLADLVLLDANPLDDITNTTTIRAVVANGRYFDRAALDSLSSAVQSNGP